jgi:hypothetical protein
MEQVVPWKELEEEVSPVAPSIELTKKNSLHLKILCMLPGLY